MQSYDPTWGRLKPSPSRRRQPRVPDPGATGYFDYFNGAGVRRAGRRPRKGYYSSTSAPGTCRAELQLLPTSAARRARRRRRGCARTSPPTRPVHARVLAPPALQLGQARQRRHHAAALPGRSTTPAPTSCSRPRPRLRAVRPAGPGGQADRARHPRSSWSAPAAAIFTRRHHQAQQPGPQREHLRRARC